MNKLHKSSADYFQIYKLIRENLLHGVKVGRSYRIAKSELFRFLKVLPSDREERGSSQYQIDIFREG